MERGIQGGDLWRRGVGGIKFFLLCTVLYTLGRGGGVWRALLDSGDFSFDRALMMRRLQ